MKSIITFVFCAFYFVRPSFVSGFNHKHTVLFNAKLEQNIVSGNELDSSIKIPFLDFFVLMTKKKLVIQYIAKQKIDLKVIAQRFEVTQKEINLLSKTKGKLVLKNDTLLIPTNKKKLLKITKLNFDTVYKFYSDSLRKLTLKNDTSLNSKAGFTKDSTIKEFHANANSIDFKEVFTHIVQNNETIEMIAKKYKISVSDIINWNELGVSKIKIGQELIINGAKARKPHIAINLPNKKSQNVSLKISDSSVFVEKGLCLLTNEGTNEVSHKNLPVGTLVLVTNLTTRKSIFLKITQNFTNTNNDIVLMMDKAIAQKIGIEKNNSLVELKFSVGIK